MAMVGYVRLFQKEPTLATRPQPKILLLKSTCPLRCQGCQRVVVRGLRSSCSNQRKLLCNIEDAKDKFYISTQQCVGTEISHINKNRDNRNRMGLMHWLLFFWADLAHLHSRSLDHAP